MSEYADFPGGEKLQPWQDHSGEGRELGAALRRRRGSARLAESALVPAKVVVEHMARNEPGADSTGDGLQLAVADQTANLVLGAAELGGHLADGQGCRPVHVRSIAAPPAAVPLVSDRSLVPESVERGRVDDPTGEVGAVSREPLDHESGVGDLRMR